MEKRFLVDNAFYDCIFAKTDMIPWLQKQFSKGPPDVLSGMIYMSLSQPSLR